MVKINYRLLPIKAHFFFFMAAMGPILPQINVFAKQLGISPDVMGFVTSILPIMYVLTKPAVGFLIDYFPNFRKTIFMSIVLLMLTCYGGFVWVPNLPGSSDVSTVEFNFTPEAMHRCPYSDFSVSNDVQCGSRRLVECSANNMSITGVVSTINASNFACTLTEKCSSIVNCLQLNSSDVITCKLATAPYGNCLYESLTFWIFIVLMCFGTIGFNVANCVSDATCFDVLGDKTMKYGAQRVWGTIGFGVTALISGIIVHLCQSDTNDSIQMITPALVIMLAFGACDIISIKWLHLPKFSNEGEKIASKVWDLLTQKSVAIFLVFATFAGIIDSFIIYYMFWHLEEVAERTNHMSSIKLIEGCVVAAECLGGEIIFFLISGKILKRIGYVHCLSFCFFMYSIRLALISWIPNPWWLVAVELVMQGCTYALCYTCIVAYASAVAPPGTSATVQGLVAGMDDGAGFAIGSLIGGQMYKRLGGTVSFRVFAVGAFVICIAHILLRPSELGDKLTAEEKVKDSTVPKTEISNEGDESELEILQKKAASIS